MTISEFEAGIRVVLPHFAESQEDAIQNVLQFEEMPVPDPATLKSTDVIVRIRSASVTFIDMLMLSGQYQHKPPLFGTPGMEYSGDVVWAGADVDRSRMGVGDRVLSDFLVTGPRSTGDYQAYGGWATYAAAPQEGVHRLAESLSYDQGANLLLNYETAHYALVTRAKLQPGETVMITGASGAAGMAAVQVAKLLGANVIATGRSDAKLALLKDRGADFVINTSPRAGESGIPRFRDEVKEFTRGKGAEVVYDTVGGGVGLESMRSLGFGGRFVVVGWAGNTTVAKGGARGGSSGADMLPTNIMQMKGLHVMGSPMVIHSGREPAIRPPRIAAVVDWVSRGLIDPYVSHTYPLASLREAATAKLNGQVSGGCVVNP